jgi:hypothetical protein
LVSTVRCLTAVIIVSPRFIGGLAGVMAERPVPAARASSASICDWIDGVALGSQESS